MCVYLCDNGDTKISFACMNGNVAEKTVDSTILRKRNSKRYWRTENLKPPWHSIALRLQRTLQEPLPQQRTQRRSPVWVSTSTTSFTTLLKKAVQG